MTIEHRRTNTPRNTDQKTKIYYVVGSDQISKRIGIMIIQDMSEYMPSLDFDLQCSPAGNVNIFFYQKEIAI